MGNSAHSRISKEGTEGSPKSFRQKSFSCAESSVGEESKAANDAPAAAENGPKSKALVMELNVKPEPLTEEQMGLLQENWKELEDNIAKVGVITFISLFETHPDVQEVFLPFQGMELEELRHSKQLKAHALRVMAFVQKAVARLHEPDKLDVLLRELGKKHYTYGAKQEYIDYIAPQFIQAIKPSMEDKWTKELEEAWTALFNYMGVIMKAAMDLEERRAAAESLPPYNVPPPTCQQSCSALPPTQPPNFAPSKGLHHASRRASSDVGGDGVGAAGSTSLLASKRRGTLY